jgi:hypothetical protein
MGKIGRDAGTGDSVTEDTTAQNKEVWHVQKPKKQSNVTGAHREGGDRAGQKIDHSGLLAILQFGNLS